MKLPAGGKAIIDCMIGVAVNAPCNLFSCNADAGTWISKTLGSEFGELAKAGNLYNTQSLGISKIHLWKLHFAHLHIDMNGY